MTTILHLLNNKFKIIIPRWNHLVAIKAAQESCWFCIMVSCIIIYYNATRCTVNVMYFNHSKTIPICPWSMEIFSSMIRFLMSHRVGAAILQDNVGSEVVRLNIKSSNFLVSYWAYEDVVKLSLKDSSFLTKYFGRFLG